MRALAALSMLCFLVRYAAAEPQAGKATPPPDTAKPGKVKAKAKAKTAPGAQKSARPGSKPKAGAPGVDLGSMAEAAARDHEPGTAGGSDATTPNGARRVDLSPWRLFGKSGAAPGADRRGKERTNALDLGNDSSWKVQAAQIGIITAGFAALWALCGGGKCMLPDSFGGGSAADRLGPSPDLEIRDQTPAPRPAH
jgi:hypothetical protein